MSEIERPPHYGEGPETRTEMGEEGPSYEDFPTGTDVGFPVDTEPSAAVEPIPVVVLGTPTEQAQYVQWRPGRYFVDSARPVQLAGGNLNRQRLVVRNANAAGGNSVFLVPTSTFNPADGYELQPQAELELYHNDEVWAMCLATQTANVAVSGEYALEAPSE